MGTRNLTCVVLGGEYRVAKYCQWDGYPEGKGASIVAFLVDGYDPDRFRAQLGRLVQLSREAIETRWVAAGADPGAETVSFEVARRFGLCNSHLDRDMGGGDFLAYLQSADPPEVAPSSLEFAADSLFCEWAYVLDLDRNTFEVFEGFNEKPLAEGERFAFLEPQANGGYHPVRHVATFPIDDLSGLRGAWDEWMASRTDEDEE